MRWSSKGIPGCARVEWRKHQDLGPLTLVLELPVCEDLETRVTLMDGNPIRVSCARVTPSLVDNSAHTGGEVRRETRHSFEIIACRVLMAEPTVEDAPASSCWDVPV